MKKPVKSIIIFKGNFIRDEGIIHNVEVIHDCLLYPGIPSIMISFRNFLHSLGYPIIDIKMLNLNNPPIEYSLFEKVRDINNINPKKNIIKTLVIETI